MNVNVSEHQRYEMSREVSSNQVTTGGPLEGQEALGLRQTDPRLPTSSSQCSNSGEEETPVCCGIQETSQPLRTGGRGHGDRDGEQVPGQCLR